MLDAEVCVFRVRPLAPDRFETRPEPGGGLSSPELEFETELSPGIPTETLWAGVPHYVAGHTPSPKATLALLDRLEDLTGARVPRADLATEAATWEASIDAAAADDEEMTEYIHQLERTRDTWDSPEASGDAIAQEFEKYLRRRGDGPRGGGKDDPRR